MRERFESSIRIAGRLRQRRFGSRDREAGLFLSLPETADRHQTARHDNENRFQYGLWARLRHRPLFYSFW
jgi:hypothetical protein